VKQPSNHWLLTWRIAALRSSVAASRGHPEKSPPPNHRQALRLRGPCGAQFEFTLAAIAQNLRRLAKSVVRPPPVTKACFA
jgi:hypothetical protein